MMKLPIRNQDANQSLWSLRDDHARAAWKMADEHSHWSLGRVSKELAAQGITTGTGKEYGSSATHHLLCIAHALATTSISKPERPKPAEPDREREAREREARRLMDEDDD